MAIDIKNLPDKYKRQIEEKLLEQGVSLNGKGKKKNKYRNKKVQVDGITFDSRGEAKRYEELKILKRAGKIKELELQPEFLLLDGYRNGKGVWIQKMVYKADFAYIDVKTNRTVIEDVKGIRTEGFNIKKKLFEKKYHPLTITLIQI